MVAIGRIVIRFEGSYLWNSLPDDLKSVISAHSFAKHLKKFMMIKVYTYPLKYMLLFKENFLGH